MPFVICKVNVPVSREQEVELKERLGRAIELVPGKSERGLLVAVEDCCRLWLAGDDDPLAYVQADVFANEGHVGYAAFSAEMASAFKDILDIPPERVYVRYGDIPVWSVADMLVELRMFI